MCLSPHEMTSAKIEHVIEVYKESADKARERGDLQGERYWLRQVENFLKILKERAEDGTYHDNANRY